MTFQETKQRHEALAEEIRRHDYAYYVLAQPAITDLAYDRLYRELIELEAQFPKLITPESPTQRVGGQPLKEFKPVQHLEPMYSLDNTYSEGELREFVNRVHRLLPGETLEWVVEPKIDARRRHDRGRHHGQSEDHPEPSGAASRRAPGGEPAGGSHSGGARGPRRGVSHEGRF
jgi:hypothetical protein